MINDREATQDTKNQFRKTRFTYSTIFHWLPSVSQLLFWATGIEERTNRQKSSPSSPGDLLIKIPLWLRKGRHRIPNRARTRPGRGLMQKPEEGCRVTPGQHPCTSNEAAPGSRIWPDQGERTGPGLTGAASLRWERQVGWQGRDFANPGRNLSEGPISAARSCHD